VVRSRDAQEALTEVQYSEDNKRSQLADWFRKESNGIIAVEQPSDCTAGSETKLDAKLDEIHTMQRPIGHL